MGLLLAAAAAAALVAGPRLASGAAAAAPVDAGAEAGGLGRAADALGCGLTRVHGPSLRGDWEEFLRLYQDRRQPVVLTGLTDEWPLTDWDQATWVARLGEVPLRVRGPLLHRAGGSSPFARLTLRQYVDGGTYDAAGGATGGAGGGGGDAQAQVETDEDDDGSIAFENEYSDVAAAVDDQYQVPALFNRSVHGKPIFSLGRAGAKIGFHYHATSWLAQLRGRKAWFLVDAWTTRQDWLEQHGVNLNACRLLRGGPAEVQARSGGADIRSCVVGPSELIFLPGDTFHATCSVDGFTVGLGWEGDTWDWHETTRAAAAGNVGALRAAFERLDREEGTAAAAAKLGAAAAPPLGAAAAPPLGAAPKRPGSAEQRWPPQGPPPGRRVRGPSLDGPNGRAIFPIRRPGHGPSPGDPRSRGSPKFKGRGRGPGPGGFPKGGPGRGPGPGPGDFPKRGPGPGRGPGPSGTGGGVRPPPPPGELLATLSQEALRFAARAGHKGAVELLLDREPELAPAAVHLAAAYGRAGMLKLLARRAADEGDGVGAGGVGGGSDGGGGRSSGSAPSWRRPSHWEWSVALAQAAAGGHLEALTILEGGGRGLGAQVGAAAVPALSRSLGVAAKHGHVPVLAFLLERRARVDVAEPSGVQAVHEAAGQGHVAILERLAAWRADLSAATESGGRPLHAAVLGHAQVTDFLLEQGADVRARLPDGTLALHVAARSGHEAVVEVLLRRRAEVGAVNARGGTPVHHAAIGGHREIIARLLAERADVDVADKQGTRPLHLCAAQGHPHAAEHLLQIGAESDAEDHIGMAPLHLAAEFGHTATLERLLAARADMSKRSGPARQLPYDLAARENHAPVMALLRASVQNYTVREIDGVSYLSFMTAEGFRDLQRQGRLRGTDVVVAAFPRCGTTWTQRVLLALLAGGDVPQVRDVASASLWLEGLSDMGEMAAERLRDWEGPPALGGRRVLKTHAPAAAKPWAHAPDGMRVIIVSRNPKDAAVSNFHHSKDVDDFNYKEGEWSHFLGDLFLPGQVAYGDFWEWHASWWREHEANPKRVLWLSYEELHSNMSSCILRMADFCNISTSHEVVEAVAWASSFATMKRQASEADVERFHRGEAVKRGHVRQGGVGLWRQYFSSQQAREFDDHHQRRCEELSLPPSLFEVEDDPEAAATEAARSTEL